jgi:uncharacterized protein YdeI (BOF family)
MGAFDLPPSTPPVSFDPPPNSPGRRSAGRTAAVAAACVALIAASVLAVAQFASDEATPVVNAAQETGTTPPTPAPETTAPAPTTVPTAEQAPDDTPDEAGDLDGQIVIQIGDGEPIVLDLGDLGSLGDLAGGEGDLGDFGKIEQCLGDFAFDIDLDLDLDAAPGELSLPGLFGDDDLTVAGPDGLSVLDFGDGDGSVTITKQDGEITITSEGDVQVDDLAALDAPALGSLPPLPDFDQIYECLEDATG